MIRLFRRRSPTPDKTLLPVVIPGNNHRLISALVDHAKAGFGREIRQRIESMATIYDGDGCSFTYTLTINAGAVRMLAGGVGVKLPEVKNGRE